MALTEERMQQLLAEQDQRQVDRTEQLLTQQEQRIEARTKELLAEQDQRTEVRTTLLLSEQKTAITTETKAIVVDAINQIVIPVLDEVLEKQKETLDRVEVLEHRRDVQQIALDDHGVRMTVLEKVRI